MFGWGRKRRRKKILAAPLPEQWRKILRRNLWQYRSLTERQRAKLEECIRIFAAEKRWEGCDGLQINDEVIVTIAGQASLLLLGTADYYFDGVKTVLVYPRSFRRKSRSGWIVDEDQHNAGEAWQGGPIVLSWRDVLSGNADSSDGHNVVVHEFAHHLDGLDGEMGGSPPFDNSDDQKRWIELLEEEYQALLTAVRAEEWTLLDYYGATNKAEFFAVACESFFEIPADLQRAHPELYELLTRFYKIDPSLWD